MRTNREKVKDGTYFVKSSIIPETAKELCSDATQSMFMDVLEEAMTKYNIKIENFVVLKDEFQFVIQTIDTADISDVMQWIKQVFSIRFNKKFNRSGTVWRGRFKSILLKIQEKIEEFKEIIDNLPIRLELCRLKEEFIYSGAYHIKNNIRLIIKVFAQN